MRPDDKRQTCVCGHRYSVHFPSGPCAAADTPEGQVTGQGCQCKEWHPWAVVGERSVYPSLTARAAATEDEKEHFFPFTHDR